MTELAGRPVLLTGGSPGVEVVRVLLRFFSYLFHALLALFLLAISGVALLSGAPNLRMEMLPWTGPTLVHVLFYGSLFGLITVLLAMRGMLRILFFLWSLAVLYFMVKGYWISGYRFEPGEHRTALWLLGGSLLALPGAWFQMRRKLKRAKRH
jgi:hypothetical protein